MATAQTRFGPVRFPDEDGPKRQGRCWRCLPCWRSDAEEDHKAHARLTKNALQQQFRNNRGSRSSGVSNHGTFQSAATFQSFENSNQSLELASRSDMALDNLLKSFEKVEKMGVPASLATVFAQITPLMRELEDLIRRFSGGFDSEPVVRSEVPSGVGRVLPSGFDSSQGGAMKKTKSDDMDRSSRRELSVKFEDALLVMDSGDEDSANDPRNVKTATFADRQLDMEGGLAPAMNEFVRYLWPRIDKYVDTLIHQTVEPKINASLPGLLKGGVKFGNVTLGESYPIFGPFVTETTKGPAIGGDSDAIEFHMGVKFTSELEMCLEAMGINVGIRSFSLEGKLVVVFAPPLSRPPFFGGVQVFFPNPPRIAIEFTGAAKLASLPGLRGAVRSALTGAIASACVLPKRIAVDVDHANASRGVDLTDLRNPEPIGVLRVTLHSGEGLAGGHSRIGRQKKADPYVVATLGLNSWKSAVVAKSSAPVWTEDATVDFPVHNHLQTLSLEVYDYDFARVDDQVGFSKPVTVEELASEPGRKIVLPLLKQDPEIPVDREAGSLTVSAELLELVHRQPEDPPSGPSPTVAHLSVKVVSVWNVGRNGVGPFTVRLRVLASPPDNPLAIGVTASASAVLGGSISSGTSSLETAVIRKRATTLQTAALQKALPKGEPEAFGHKPSDRGRSMSMRAKRLMGFGSSDDDKPDQMLAEIVSQRSRPGATRAVDASLVEFHQPSADGDSDLPNEAKFLGVALHNAGHHGPEEIAQALDADGNAVKAFLAAYQSSCNEMLREREEEANRNATHHEFCEVLQVLLPAVPSEGFVEITLMDKAKRKVGTAQLPLEQILDEAEEGRCPMGGPAITGPFVLDSGAKVVGSAWLRWILAPDTLDSSAVSTFKPWAS